MKKQTRLIIVLTIINVLVVSCGAIKDSKASSSYRLVDLFGYECITNDVALWCR